MIVVNDDPRKLKLKGNMGTNIPCLPSAPTSPQPIPPRPNNSIDLISPNDTLPLPVLLLPLDVLSSSDDSANVDEDSSTFRLTHSSSSQL
jgi:hypothetical protein